MEVKAINMESQDKGRAYLRAKNRVEQIRGFYVHLAIYLVINTGITVYKVVRDMNHGDGFFEALTSFDAMASWLLWGLGLALHAFGVFGLPMILGNNWEEDRIQKFMEEERKNNQ